MKQVWRLLLIGLLAYLFFMAVNIPARQVQNVINEHVDGIRMQGATGTIRGGTAARLDLEKVILNQFQWRLRPIDLLLGSLAYNVEFQDGLGAGDANVGSALLGGVFLRSVNFESRLDRFSRLIRQIPPIMGEYTVSLRGDLRLDLDEFTLEGGYPGTAVGQVRWDNAILSIPNGGLTLNFGRVELVLDEVDKGIQGTFSNQGGEFGGQGELSLSPQGDYQITLILNSRTRWRSDEMQILKMVGGEPQRDGGYRFDFSGKY